VSKRNGNKIPPVVYSGDEPYNVDSWPRQWVEEVHVESCVCMCTCCTHTCTLVNEWMNTRLNFLCFTTNYFQISYNSTLEFSPNTSLLVKSLSTVSLSPWSVGVSIHHSPAYFPILLQETWMILVISSGRTCNVRRILFFSFTRNNFCTLIF
jgi:hypothetical protein